MSIDYQAALSLRREIYGDGRAIKKDFERLVALGRADTGKASPAFGDLMSDVALDVMVNDVDPPKYVQSADAAWLIALLSKDGGLANEAEHDTLVRLIRNAVSLPPELSAFAVAQIERAVIAAGAVGPDDLEALRTVVFAGTEGSALHVSRDDAEALFRIADALSDVNNPAFDDFFAKAIGNYLMGVAYRWTPSAEQARRTHDWLDKPAPRFGAFVSSMLDFDRLILPEDDQQARRMESDDMALRQAAPIDAAEADWLLLRLHRDGKISQAEKRLLSFLKQEATTVAPALAALMEKAA